MKKISNPDLHLSQSFSPSVILEALQAISGTLFTGIIEIEEIVEVQGACVQLIERGGGDFPLSLNIYRIPFSEQQAIQLARLLQCLIATDYTPELKPWQWQVLFPDGSVATLTLELDDEDGLYLPKDFVG